MMHRSTGMVGIAAVAFASLTAFAAARQTPTAEVMSLGLRGVYFVENQGQWSDASVEYGFKTRGLDIAFRESSFTMHLARESSQASPTRERGIPDEGAWASRPYEAGAWASPPYERSIAPEASPTRERGVPFPDDADPLPHGRGSSSEAVDYEHLTLTVTFPGSNPATPRGAQAQAAKFNYYIGDDESRWASNVPSFAAIIYENLYDGVDLLICGNDDGVLKYEFHVAPGADWNQIRIAYAGIESLCVDESGNLRIKTSFGTLTDSAPLVWQEDAVATSDAHARREAREPGRAAPTSRHTIPARFELINATTYCFALDGPVDPRHTLIIDPLIDWMRYLGGSSEDFGAAIAVDAAGECFVAGETRSLNLDGRINDAYGLSDAFASAVSSTGQLRWTTYLGGRQGDYGLAVAIDHAGEVLVTGRTESSDFAGRTNSLHGLFADAFLLKLDSSGSLLWMVYLGGAEGADSGSAIAVDPFGDILVAGDTSSDDFEGRINSAFGSLDGFVLRTDPSGAVEWMTYLGGSAIEDVFGLAAAPDGHALVVGGTASTDFVGRNNLPHGGTGDAFAVRVDRSGNVQWMTYLGGTSHERATGAGADSDGNLLLAGLTTSTDFVGRRNSYFGGIGGGGDGFTARVDAGGSLVWMSYIGGRARDEAHGIAVVDSGEAWVTGLTHSWDFSDQINTFNGGMSEAFVTRIDLRGESLGTVFLGGSGSDQATGVAVDAERNAYVTGSTQSMDFVRRLNSHRGSATDAFIAKARVEGPRLSVRSSCPDGGPIRIEWNGASPSRLVALLFARDTGWATVPPGNRCEGTVLGLGTDQLRVAFSGSAGPDGSRTLNASAGPNACGGYLQLLDLATCHKSNVVRIE